jgi:hypothetical protein
MFSWPGERGGRHSDLGRRALSGFFFGTFCFAPDHQRKKYADFWQDIAVFILPAFLLLLFLAPTKKSSPPVWHTTKQKVYFIDL